MTLPTVSIRQMSHNQVYRCIRVLTMYIIKFAPHHLIKLRQAAEFRPMKDGLDDADVLLHFNFTENFSCSDQEAIQSAYWCQSQVSIFTVAVYRKDSDPEMHALITDLTDHTKTTIVVYLEYLLNIYAVYGSNILLWSDGPSNQFKNRFMARFMEMSEEKHAPNISWNFFATSHGKGAVDGVGGLTQVRGLENCVNVMHPSGSGYRWPHGQKIKSTTTKVTL